MVDSGITSCKKLHILNIARILFRWYRSRKSHLIKAVCQAGVQFSTSRPGSNVNVLNILLSLPIGKAVHNINGFTLHSVCYLPVSQFQSNLPALSAKQLSLQLSDIRLFVIDEISLAGYRQFLQVEGRLGQILKKSEMFGSMSVVCIRGFRQVKPVSDNYLSSKGKLMVLHEFCCTLGNFLHV